MSADIRQDVLKGAGLLGALFTSMAGFAVFIHLDQSSHGCVVDKNDPLAMAYNPVTYAVSELYESISGLQTSKETCAPGWEIK